MVTLADIQRARQRLSGLAHRTPLLSSQTLSAMAGAPVFLKAENLQRTGSFKVRGAANRIAHLSGAERRRGVIAASAGNHAQGVALAAQRAGTPCTIVMPRHASIAKVEATRGYGAQVVLAGDSYDEAQRHAGKLAEEKGLALVHPFDDPQVIAGQGTLALEVLDEAPDVRLIAVPVGGGGLIAGIAVAVKALAPRVRVVGVQAAAAPACVLSVRRGRAVAVRPGPTVADGIAVGRPGRLTLPLVRRYVDDMVTVDEEDITRAIILLMERCKQVVEGAGAVALAALLAGKAGRLDGPAVAVLSGGNIDSNVIARVVEHGLAHAGRYLVLHVALLDRPGQLARLLNVIAEAEGNVLDVSHVRRGLHLPIGQVEVQVTLETRGPDHVGQVLQRLDRAGYEAIGAPPEAAVPIRAFRVRTGSA
ncbi:MAG: threonine ammonia-lyase [Chloroflexi bacterium]|nr:threonine ammonia-lyase [Chloroflexota bacterium]